MNQLVLRLTAVLSSAVLCTSCGKKKTAPTAAPVPVQAGPASAPPQAPAQSVVAGQAGVPDPSGVPADLLASDKAYEAWFAKYHLDINDPKMLEADPDGDGASNREEFVAGTDPRDAGSRPGVHKVMRLKEFVEVNVPLMLESVDGHTAKIKELNGPEPKTQTLAVGQSVQGLKVARISVRHKTDKNGEPVDLSQVDLEDPVSKAKVVLVKDMSARSADSYAMLSSADGTTVKVRQGEVFVWPGVPQSSYRVIDLRHDQVVVQEVETNQMWTLPRP